MSLAFSNKVAFSSATDAALLQSEYIALVAEPNIAGQQAGEFAGVTAIGLDPARADPAAPIPAPPPDKSIQRSTI
jgi:hypothetical protein